MKIDFVTSAENVEVLSHDEFIKKLNEFIEDKYRKSDEGVYSGAKINAAWIWGISRTMVSKVLSKDNMPTKSMLDDIEYDQHKIIVYTKRKPCNPQT